MIYIIMGVTFLFILGPILMLRLSPREQRQARLRDIARAHQIDVSPVSLSREPRYNKLQQRNPHIKDYQWVRYKLTAREGEPGPGLQGVWLQRKTAQGERVWEPENVTQKAPAVIDSLLAGWHSAQCKGLLALEVQPNSVALVWNESETEAGLEALCTDLHYILVNASMVDADLTK